jgi:hypothetical protein
VLLGTRDAFQSNCGHQPAGGMAMRTVVRVFAMCAALLGVRVTAMQITNGADAFSANIAAYIGRHHQVERFLPPQRNYVDPEEGLAYAAALRRAICAVRPDAREGDVFAPAAGELRRRVRYALRAHGIEVRELLLEMIDDTAEGARPPAVNEPFSWALGNLMPAAIIDALPPLPDELQYRLVGGHLVLVDLHAGLVVDILRHALPVGTTTR